jgi:hypothetical protein
MNKPLKAFMAPSAKDSSGRFWTRHGLWDSHVPERLAYIGFSTNDVSQARQP